MKLRKLIAVLSALLMLCSLIPAGALVSAEAGNMIENGDFETGSFDTGWEKSWYAPSIATDIVHGGSYAMKTANTTSQYQTMIKSKAITVEANTDYTVSFWYYYDGTATDAGAYVFIKGNGSTDIKNVVTASPTTEWKQATVEFNSGSYTSVTLFFQNKTANAGGNFYFDDVVMTKVGGDEPDPEPQYAVNRITNGDFEANADGWDIKVTNAEVIDDPTASGQGKVMKTLETTNGETVMFQQVVSLEANTDYVLKFKMYCYSTNTNAVLYMRLGNGDIIPNFDGVEGLAYADKSSSSTARVRLNVQENTGKWVDVVIPFNSGSNTSTTIGFANYRENEGKYYFDDVTLYKEGEEPAPEPEPEPDDGNLITNGDFEANADGWDVKVTNAEVIDDPTGAGQGKVMKTLETTNGETVMFQQAVSLEANTDYVLRFKMYCYSTATNAVLYMRLGNGDIVPDFDGVEGLAYADKSSSSTARVRLNVQENTGKWVDVVIPFNSGSNTSTTIGFANYRENEGKYYFDDVTLYKKGEEPEPEPEPEPWTPGEVPVVPNNAVKNGNFESGQMTNWTYYYDTEASADAAYTGSYGAILSGETAWSALMNQTIPVEQGVLYDVTFWAKAVEGSIKYYVEDGKNGTRLVDEQIKNTEWTQYRHRLTSDNAVFFMNFYHTGTAGKATVYVDDIQVTPAPMMTNGDFETGDNTGWTVYNGSGVTADAKKNGAYGMQLSGKGNWGSMAYQNVTVTPGKTYIVSAWLKAVATGANMQIRDGGSSGTQLASGWFDKTEWTQVSYVVTPTTDTLHVNFHSSGKGVTETVYLDDVQVIAIADDGALDNGSFETGSISPWIVYYGSDVSTEAAYEGYYGAHLKGNGSWGAMIYQDFATEAGKKYNFTAYFKTISTGANIQIKDVNGDTVTDIASTWYNGTEWTQVSIEFIALGTTTRVNVCGGGNGNAESVYMDNAAVIEVKDPSFDGYLYNGDFEAGSLTKWNVYQSTEISGEAAYTGDYGAKMIGNGGWDATLEQTFDVEVGKTYKVSFWFKAMSNGINLTVKGKQDNKTLASYYMAQTTGSGAKWVYYEKTFQSAYNTSVTLNFSGSGKETRDEVWIDDIKIENLSGDEMDRCENVENGGISIRDTEDDERGLAFRFTLNANDTQYIKGNQYVAGTGTVKLYQYADTTATLMETGAIMSNLSGDNLTLDAVDGGKTIKVTAKYLLDWESDAIQFAVRIVKIPDAGINTEIYARPYYTYEIDGETVTIYGDVVSDSYAAVEAARRTKRVLMLGDAASYDNMDTYLYDALKSAAYDQVILGHLDDETYHKNDDNGEWVTSTSDAATAITDERWQYVVVTNDADLEWANANKPYGAQVLYYSDSIPTEAKDNLIPAGTTLANLTGIYANATDAEKEFAVTIAWFIVLTGENYDLVTDIPDAVVDRYYNVARSAAHAVYDPCNVSDLTEVVLLAGSDYQPSKWEDGPAIVEGLLAGVQTDGYGLFDGFFGVGDYASGSGHELSSLGLSYLDDIIDEVAYGNRMYAEGNHDRPTTVGVAASGNNDPLGAPYGVFVINEEDYQAYGGGNPYTTAANLTAYLNEKINSDTWGNKPIFVLGHVPLNYSRRTLDEGCAKYAQPIVDALNAGGEAGLNIIYMFGHNHSGDYDAYIGGGSVYLAKGDSILVSDTESVNNAPHEETLHFTYMTAGYINYYANAGENSDSALTMTTFRILADGSVVVSRYDANGEHNLKAKGVLNDRDLDNQYIVNALDETVYGPQRIVTATSDEAYNG